MRCGKEIKELLSFLLRTIGYVINILRPSSVDDVSLTEFVAQLATLLGDSDHLCPQ